MKKQWRWFMRCIAMTLTLALLICQIPVGAIAVSDESETIQSTAPQDVNEATVVAEDVSKREESVKHFRMSDGTYRAVQYDIPVHFMQDGQWVDYDNTLVDSISDEGTADLVNTTADYKVRLSKKTNGKKWVRLEKDGYKISWYYTDAAKSTGVTTETKDDGDPTTLENAVSTVTYADIYDNIDLRYRVSPTGIKEDLILKKRGTQTTFVAEYNIDKLTAVQTDAQTIELRDADGAVVYTLSAPYMTDAEGAISTAMTYRIVSTKNKRITVELTADEVWLNSKDREYPVAVDPAVSTGRLWSNNDDFESTFISSENSNTAYGAITDPATSNDYDLLRAGHLETYGDMRILLQSLTLPQIDANDVIVRAEYTIKAISTFEGGMLNAYPITSTWQAQTAKWNSNIKYDSTAIDRVNIDTTSEPDSIRPGCWNHFDVTSAVNGWYNDPGSNHGIILISDVEGSDENQSMTFFNGKYLSNPPAVPYFTVYYRNASGLEDTWAFVGSDAGRAGSAVVNVMNGNLVVTQSLTLADDNSLLPVSVSLTYNSNCASTLTSHSTVGKGWQTNYHLSVSENTEINAASTDLEYYFTDSDGTRHYFLTIYDPADSTEEDETNSDSQYIQAVDEDGLGYTLKVDPQIANTDTVTTKYTITDLSGNKMEFNGIGNLMKITDTTGKTNTLSYTTVNGVQRLNTITDGAGRVYTLIYKSTAPTVIAGIKDPFNRTTSLSYTNTRLTGITYPDGKSVTIGYQSNGKLSSIKGSDGLTTSAVYSNERGQVAHLSRSYITEESTTIAEQYTFAYGLFETQVTDYQGTKIAYQYNGYGQITGVVSHADGTAQFYEYNAGNSTSRAANKVLSESRTQSSVNNLLKNSRFDEGDDGYSAISAGVSKYSHDWDSAYGNFGKGSLKVTCSEISSTNNSHTFYCQKFNAPKNGYYTFSGYISTNGATLIDQGAQLRIERWNSDATVQYEGKDSRVLHTKADEWKKVSITMYATAGETLKCLVGTCGVLCTGTMWFDDLQMEYSATANVYNLIDNAGFNHGTWGWDAKGSFSTVTLDTLEMPGFSYAGKLSDNLAESENYAAQTIEIKNGKDGDVYSLSGWAKGLAAPSQEFALCAEFLDNNGDVVDTFSADYNPLITSWQMASVKLIAPAEYTAIRVYYSRADNINDMYITGLCLQYEEYGQTYTYDENGQVISSVGLTKKESAFSYSDSELVRQLNPSGSSYLYTYDSRDLVTSAISTDGVEYELDYDDDGNNTEVTLKPLKLATSLTEGKQYYLINADSALSLDATDTSDTKLSKYVSGTTAMQWRLSAQDETGVYKLYSGDNTLTCNGVTFHTNTADTTQNSNFKLVRQDDNSYVILCGNSTFSKCLDTETDNDKTVLRSTTYDAESVFTSQKWYVYEVAAADAQYIKTLASYTDGYLMSVTDALDNTTGYTYNEHNGLMATVTDAKAQVTAYSYNTNNNNLTAVTADGKTITYTYDAADRVSSITAPNGQTYHFIYDVLGRNTAITIGTGTNAVTLCTMEYDIYGHLVRQEYANGSAYAYGYDNMNRLQYVIANGNSHQLLFYNTDGEQAAVLDVPTQTVVRYVYDRSGRQVGGNTYAYASLDTTSTLVAMARKVMACTRLKSGAEYTYADKTDYLVGESLTTPIGSTEMQYTYGDLSAGQMPDTVYTVSGTNSLSNNRAEKVEYTYDELGRIRTRKTYTNVATGAAKTSTYTYVDGNQGENSTTTLVQSITTDGVTYSYTYDALGNITQIKKNGAVVESYEYDALNQLTKVTGADGTYHEYVYDDNGNIVQVKQNGSVVRTYTYGNGMWKDQLTAVGTQSISYDEAGNPLSYMGATMRWTNGRLPSYVSRNGHAVSYTYASDGTRATKTADDITTTYHYVGGRLYGEKSYGESVGYSTRVYLYDDTDSPYGYIYNGTTYYYEKNLQGDVVGIWHQNGTKIVNYTYDVWGKLVSMTDQYGNSIINEQRHQGNLNPIRYRGYYYDAELELYWLSTRFYDPEIGRWINADDSDVLGIEPGSLLHYNLFAYCWNNPVNMTDDNGYLPWFVAAAVGGALFDTAAYLIGSAISGQEITWAGVGKAALTGAVTGVAFGALGKGVKALTTAAKATKVGVKIGATFGKMGKLVKYRKIAVNWNIITRHGLKRMSERGMSKSLINSVIKNGKVLQQTANKFAYISKKGVVIIESNGKIVTAYSNKFFDETIKGYVKQLFG